MEPEKFGPFKIVRMLGRGGMGKVYEGICEADGAPVAIKVLTDSQTCDEDARERFEYEIETLKRLHHPNIVRLTGFGEEQGQLYYAMEVVDGISLQQEVRSGRTFQWHEAAKIGLEICLAFRHAHDRGIIHRDIKPANILLDREGNVKLADFGIARFFGSPQLTSTHAVVGTLEYMSPEQALAHPVSATTDLYALGCVLYALLTGKPPHLAKSLPELLRKYREGPPAPLRTLRLDAPEELEHIVSDLLQPLPGDRPRNASLVARRLQSLLYALHGDPATIKVLPTPVALAGDSLRKSFERIAAGFMSEGADDAFPSPTVTVHSDAGRDADFDIEQPYDAERIDLLAGTGTFSMTVGPTVTEPKVAPPSEPQQERQEAVPQPSSCDSDADFDVNSEPEEVESALPPRPSTRFTAVVKTDLDPFASEGRERPVFSLPVLFVSITLLIVGLVVYYLLQPPSPDVLFARITATLRENESAEVPSPARLAAAENDIRNFLSWYPDHFFAPQVHVYLEELELSGHERRLERRMHFSSLRALSPVERAYVEILAVSPHNPDLMADKLRAFIAVYQPVQSLEEPSSFTSSPVEICVELARRRLSKLEQEIEEINAEQKQVLRRRLDEAINLDSRDPERAEAIRRGIIELYQHHHWASELVAEAKEGVSHDLLDTVR